MLSLELNGFVQLVLLCSGVQDVIHWAHIVYCGIAKEDCLHHWGYYNIDLHSQWYFACGDGNRVASGTRLIQMIIS